ncbi:hypothetical protein RRF57_001192 [Xylaria bambusicola]|uniref:Uncharacterized protein n=1 Tax=Xylaria bambusicola TaxID=326684 RepID=A0AAN7Z604_9PEZI
MYGPGRRLQHRGITATVVHPGYNDETKLEAHLTWEDYDLIDGAMERNHGIDWVVSTHMHIHQIIISRSCSCKSVGASKTDEPLDLPERDTKQTKRKPYTNLDAFIEHSGRSLPRFKTFSQIAATSLIAALDPDLVSKSPGFLQNSQVHEPEEQAKEPESVEKLWKLSEELVKQRFE